MVRKIIYLMAFLATYSSINTKLLGSNLKPEKKNPLIYQAIIDGKSLSDLDQLKKDGASVNATGACIFGKETPLHLATRRGDLQYIRWLLENGAFRYPLDSKLRTALFWANRQPNDSKKCRIHFLFEKVQPNHRKLKEQTVLNHSYLEAAKIANIRKIKEALFWGAQLNCEDEK